MRGQAWPFAQTRPQGRNPQLQRLADYVGLTQFRFGSSCRQVSGQVWRTRHWNCRIMFHREIIMVYADFSSRRILISRAGGRRAKVGERALELLDASQEFAAAVDAEAEGAREAHYPARIAAYTDETAG